MKKLSKTQRTGLLAGTFIGLIFFLLSYHVVFHQTGFGVSLIAKEHLSFANTVVDTSGFIQQWNNSSLLEKMDQRYLLNKLKEKGLLEFE